VPRLPKATTERSAALSPPRAGGAELGERHREILRVALHLFAERGYAGASLRELARRVGMQQPSLYHYFRSKEELTEQILVTFGFGGVHALPEGFALPERIEDLPRALGTLVGELYTRTDWPMFVRFLFQIALEQPRHREQVRAMFVDRTQMLIDHAMQHYRGQIDRDQGAFLARMVLNAIALTHIEEKLLFAGAGVHPDLDRYSEFVIRAAEQLVARRDGDRVIPPSPPPATRGGRAPADRRTPARGRPVRR
jgi:AcrR family transcriptional regulator